MNSQKDLYQFKKALYQKLRERGKTCAEAEEYVARLGLTFFLESIRRDKENDVNEAT